MMNTKHIGQQGDWKQRATYGLMLLIGMFASICSAADQPAAELFDETACRTVFAFDQVSIPYTQNLRLEMRSPARHSANPVVPRGKPGTPDAKGVQFYGSVIR